MWAALKDSNWASQSCIGEERGLQRDRMEKRSSAGQRRGFLSADGILAGEAASAGRSLKKDLINFRSNVCSVWVSRHEIPVLSQLCFVNILPDVGV